MWKRAHNLSSYGKGCRNHGIEVRSAEWPEHVNQTGQHHLPQCHTPPLFGKVIEAVNHSVAPTSNDA